MERDYEGSYKRDRLRSVVKFEKMLSGNESIFFDSTDLEDIIEYYLEEDQLNKALTVVDFAISQYPYSIDFQLIKTDLLISIGDYKEAVQLLEKLEKLGNNCTELFMHKGDALLFSGRYHKAVNSYRKALELTFDNKEKEDILLSLSYAYQCINKHEKAIMVLKKCLKLNPGNEDATNELGLCVEILEKFEEGIDYFKEIIDRDPYSHLAWYYLAICYRELGLYEKACEAFDYCIAIKEDYEWAYTGMADTLFHLGRYIDAIESLEEVLKIAGPSEDIYKEIGGCYMELGFQEKARKSFEKAIKYSLSLDHTDDIWFCIGQTYEKENKLFQARQCYIKAIEKYRQSEYVIALGNVEFCLKNHQSALSAYENATTIDPLNEQGWLGLAKCYFAEYDIPTAVEILKEGARYLPFSAQTKFMLSGFYCFIGQYHKGIPVLEEALEIDFEGYQALFEFLPELQNDSKVINAIEQFQ